MTAQPDAFVTALDHVADVLAHGTRPELYKAVETALGEIVGHKLLTLLMVLPGAKEVQRFWSTNEEAYPLAGKKPMGATDWGDLVIHRRQPFLGCDMAAVRWAFFDHELIASLGLGSAMSVPIIAQNEMLGVIALLDAEHHYDEDKLKAALRFAPCLVDAFRQEIALAVAAG